MKHRQYYRQYYQCDGCDETFNTKDGLEFEYTIQPYQNNQYVWCPECQKEDIPEVKVERHGHNPYSNNI